MNTREAHCPFIFPPSAALKNGVLHLTQPAKQDQDGKIEAERVEINLKEYNITNRITQLGISGLITLGILRTPKDLQAVLDSYASSQPEETDTMKSILQKAIGAKQNVERFTKQATIKSQFLSKLYTCFPNIMPEYGQPEKTFPEIVDQLLSLVDKKLVDENIAYNYLETFIDVFTSNRILLLGQTTAIYRHQENAETQNDQEKQEQIAYLREKLLKNIDKNLKRLAEAYIAVFGENSMVETSLSLPAVVDGAFSATVDLLGYLSDIGEPYGEFCRSTRRHTAISGEDHRMLSSNHPHQELMLQTVDKPISILLASGQTINVFSPVGCPFFEHAWYRLEE